ncbi:MAG TPA: PIN domain-containing protein [Candidatus Latescibacteria bacterium]|nr:PIN domain-containing protein [Candidatus Latescibacterota bacterium]HJP31079.1 PIN domain-containing protein [Candidatus Latescibacterota bacterium]
MSDAAESTKHVFLDSNILVYCADRHDSDLRARCRMHLQTLRSSGRAVISTQVLQEFYSVTTRKFSLDPIQAREFVADFRQIPTTVITPELIDEAIACHQADSISFWDALIVVAASSADCQLLLTEGLNAGQTIRGVEIIRPGAELINQPGDTG